MATYKENIMAFKANPILMHQFVYNQMEAQLNGRGEFDVPDTGHPFSALMENATLMATMTVEEGNALLRKLYPSMAVTDSELYLHMADKDYIGMFSSPAWTTFELWLDRDEVIRKAIPYGTSGARKVVIPRLTQFKVADTEFTMQYPIEIRVMSHGGLQIVYDTHETSPLQVLESSILDWNVYNLKQHNALKISIPVGQFAVRTHETTFNPALVFDHTFEFPDRFYYARIYTKTQSQGQWVEIETTHTAQVFNQTKLTALLQVIGNGLRVKIPEIYITKGYPIGEIRIDIYTTRGEIDIDSGSYASDQFTINFNSSMDDITYTSPLTTLNMVRALNSNRIFGGVNAPTFDDRRNAVIDNTTGMNVLPITDKQIESDLRKRGYGMVTNIDNITDRQFLATRRLPIPQSVTQDGVVSGLGNSFAAIGSLTGQLQITTEELTGYDSVINNGDRLTILPKMLYNIQRGIIRPVTDAQVSSLIGRTPDGIAREVNEGRYLYSPLHYVLDSTDNNFDVRPYYLDNPAIERKTFVGDNETSGMTASLAPDSTIVRTEDGYRIFVTTNSGDTFRSLDDESVILQMGYVPEGETNWASVNGVLVGKNDDDERVYSFDIKTNYDIDSDNALRTTNMTMFSDVLNNFMAKLSNQFAVSFIVINNITPDYVAGVLDTLVQPHLIQANYMVVAREILHIRLGHSLNNLWRRNRSLISEENYKKYEEDVPYVYEENIYLRDSNGAIIITIGSDGQPEYTLLHRKGEVMYDEDGEIIYRHFKGDVIYENGSPVIDDYRTVLREITLFLMDGAYYFVNEVQAVYYKNSVPVTLTNWIENDINLIQEQLLERSELYLHPNSSLGNTQALVNDGKTVTMRLDQRISVIYYMTDNAYENMTLRDSLVRSTTLTINEMLGNSLISTAAIITRLEANGGDDVISFEFHGLGGEEDYSAVTLTDGSVRMGLGKRLVVLPDQTLTAHDDIDIAFRRHSERLLY